MCMCISCKLYIDVYVYTHVCICMLMCILHVGKTECTKLFLQYLTELSERGGDTKGDTEEGKGGDSKEERGGESSSASLAQVYYVCLFLLLRQIRKKGDVKY